MTDFTPTRTLNTTLAPSPKFHTDSPALLPNQCLPLPNSYHYPISSQMGNFSLYGGTSGNCNTSYSCFPPEQKKHFPSVSDAPNIGISAVSNLSHLQMQHLDGQLHPKDRFERHNPVQMPSVDQNLRYAPYQQNNAFFGSNGIYPAQDSLSRPQIQDQSSAVAIISHNASSTVFLNAQPRGFSQFQSARPFASLSNNMSQLSHPGVTSHLFTPYSVGPSSQPQHSSCHTQVHDQIGLSAGLQDDEAFYYNPLMQLSAFACSTPPLSRDGSPVGNGSQNTSSSNVFTVNSVPFSSSDHNHSHWRYNSCQSSATSEGQCSLTESAQTASACSDDVVNNFHRPQMKRSDDYLTNNFEETKLEVGNIPSTNRPLMSEHDYQAFLTVNNAFKPQMMANSDEIMNDQQYNTHSIRGMVCQFENCGKVFDRMSQLRSHAKSHSIERPHACKECGLRFSRNHDLKRHMRIHTGVRPYVCDVCGKNFLRLDALSRHLKVNGGRGCKGRTRLLLEESTPDDESKPTEIINN